MLHAVFDRLDQIERFCGGNYKKLHDIFENFFHQLTIAGAELVFFVDGPVHDSKYDTWRKRRNSDYEKYISIFKVISETSLTDMFKIFKEIGYSPSMGAAVTDLKVLCKRYGTYRVAVDIECDTEIAKYAKENNALAVIGKDTDYMIYEGTWKYWSVMHLNLEKQSWNTFEFNKQALRDFLNLSGKQMILLSMLSGNDVIPTSALKKLHKKIHCLYGDDRNYNYYRHHFLDISKYVRTYPENLTENDIHVLAIEIFDSDSDDNLALIDDALKFYNTDINSPLTDPKLLQLASYI